MTEKPRNVMYGVVDKDGHLWYRLEETRQEAIDDAEKLNRHERHVDYQPFRAVRVEIHPIEENEND